MTYKRAALPLALFHAAMRTNKKSWENGPVAESKVYSDAASALKGLTFDGMTVMSGGFGLSGNAENLITALKEDGVKKITVIANTGAADVVGLWVLLNNGQIKNMIST